jgi:2-haloacid dehalogenase
MTGRSRPRLVVFDVVETLASLDPVADRLARHGRDRGELTGWFTRVLRDGMALTAAGGYAGFAEVAGSALTAQTRGELTDDQIDDVLAGFGELTAQPDSVAAVHAAREAAMRVFALTNGSASTTQGFLDRAGIADAFEAVLSIDGVSAWKPDPAVYRYAVETAGVPAGQVALVAVHSWDIFGARQAGLTTGWCPRLEGVPTPVFGAADVVADTLDAVVAGLAALPEGPQ